MSDQESHNISLSLSLSLSQNDSQNHPWHVHTHLPGKDYFNWTGRCLSAKGHFNPYGVDADDNMYNDCVNDRVPLKCELGDLAREVFNSPVFISICVSAICRNC